MLRQVVSRLDHGINTMLKGEISLFHSEQKCEGGDEIDVHSQDIEESVKKSQDGCGA